MFTVDVKQQYNNNNNKMDFHFKKGECFYGGGRRVRKYFCFFFFLRVFKVSGEGGGEEGRGLSPKRKLWSCKGRYFTWNNPHYLQKLEFFMFRWEWNCLFTWYK